MYPFLVGVHTALAAFSGYLIYYHWRSIGWWRAQADLWFALGRTRDFSADIRRNRIAVAMNCAFVLFNLACIAYYLR